MKKDTPFSAAAFLTLDDFNLKGKRVLLRVDLNVPVKDGAVSDDTRIQRLAPTIQYLRKAGAKIILLSHFGRPKGERKPDFSLSFIIPSLEKIWNTPVAFSEDCIGPKAISLNKALQNGEIMLLENLRFYPGEEKNDPEFAKALAAFGDIFINDAFSASHRAHASTEGITRLLPSGAGLLMSEEIDALTRALENPERPVMAVVGGSKISTKLEILHNLIKNVDYLVLGGAMANTFLKAHKAKIGKSLHEPDMLKTARKIFEAAQEHDCTLLLPEDVVVTKEIAEGAATQTVSSYDIPDDYMAVDIGPESISLITEALRTCKTIVWNGPLGIFEIPPFDRGTNALSKAVAEQTQQKKLISVAGGGDTVAALENAGTAQGFSYLSTAGGAFLEWLEGKTLPGVAALYEAKEKI